MLQIGYVVIIIEKSGNVKKKIYFILIGDQDKSSGFYSYH